MSEANIYIPGDGSFRLLPGTWYAWTIVPGYLDYPHQSAILFRAIRAKSKTRFDLQYRDASYGEGVQEFERRVKVVAWTAHAVVCMFDREEGGHRIATISELSEDWIRKLWPSAMAERSPNESLQGFLNRKFCNGGRPDTG